VTRRRSIAFSAVAASVATAGLCLSLGMAPAASIGSMSSSPKKPASSMSAISARDSTRAQAGVLVRLHVPSHRSAPRSGYELLAAYRSQAVKSADVNSCGSGFADGISFPLDPGKYQEKTGFTGASPGAIGYTWTENIVLSQDGQVVDDYTVRQSGGLADRSSWTGQHTATTTDAPADLTVSVNGTWVLANGTTCYAAGTVTGYVP
jgi:hypothetical protein